MRKKNFFPAKIKFVEENTLTDPKLGQLDKKRKKNQNISGGKVYYYTLICKSLRIDLNADERFGLKVKCIFWQFYFFLWFLPSHQTLTAEYPWWIKRLE